MKQTWSSVSSLQHVTNDPFSALLPPLGTCFKASTCRPSHSWGCGAPEAESCPPSGFTRSISFQSLARKLIPTVTHLLKGNATADDPNTPTPRSGPPTRSPTCLRRLLFRSGKVTNQVGFVFCSPRGTEKN